MRKSAILIIISCITSGYLIGTSATAYAQTSDVITVDDRNHYGQFFIDDVHVSEKDYYKVIFIDVHVKVKDLALEDFANVYWDGITLTNENGKKYKPEGNEGPDCKKEFDGTFYVIQGVKGSEGGVGQHSLCYMVEKQFNNFKAYYNIPSYSMNYPSFQIGNIDLTNSNGQVLTPSSSSSNSNLSIPTSDQVPNIFEQFMNFLKQIFSQASKTTQSLTSTNKLTATPNSVYTEDDYYAQLVPSSLQVVDKGRYNMISFSVDVNVQDLPIEGNVYFEDLYTTLHDENSKIYQPDPAECKLNDLIPIIGKQSNTATYQVCYSVDKTSSKFSIFYTEPTFNYHMTRIGYLSVDSDLFTKYKEHYTSQPIQIGTIDLAK